MSKLPTAKEFLTEVSPFRVLEMTNIQFNIAAADMERYANLHTQALKEELCEVRSGEAMMIETATAHTKRLEEKIAELEKENSKLRFQILYGGR